MKMPLTVGVWSKTVSLCDVIWIDLWHNFRMIIQSHAWRILIFNIQALGNGTNPSVILWLKYNYNINRAGILRVQFFNFCIFSMSKMIMAYFPMVELAYYFNWIWLCIDTRTERQWTKLAFILQLIRTKQSIIGWLL